MAVEDFTTYTEVDTAGYLTVDTTTVVSELPGATAAYVYKDFGADYFSGNYSIEFTFYEDGLGAHLHVFTPILLANNVASYGSITEGQGFSVSLTTITLFDRVGGSIVASDTSVLGFTPDAFTYYKLERVGDTLSLYCYSDITLTTLLDTLSITVDGDTGYRYLYPYNHDPSGASTLLVQTMDYELTVTPTEEDDNFISVEDLPKSSKQISSKLTSSKQISSKFTCN